MSRIEGRPPACRVPWLSASRCAAMTVSMISASAWRWRSSDQTPRSHQVVPQPDHRVTERPGIGFGLGSVGRGIIGCRMCADPVGDVFDQRGTQIAPRALSRPAGDSVDGEIVVAVHPERRNAKAEAARSERARATARDSLESRDRPLVVDDVEHDRCLVRGGKNQRGVKVGFGGRAVADPCRGDLRIALDRRCHGPAHRLDILRRQVAGDREEPVLLRGIQHRHLPAFQRILFVRIDLAHQVDHRMAGRDEQSCLAIGREIHITRQQRLAEGAAHRLLAHVLHIERRLALSLRHQHARVEGAQRHHVTQAGQQCLIAQETGPGADRLAVSVEHADDGIGEIADSFGINVHRWACDRAGPRDAHAREVRSATWAHRRFRHMQLQRAISCHLVTLFPLAPSRSQSWSHDATARKARFMIGDEGHTNMPDCPPVWRPVPITVYRWNEGDSVLRSRCTTVTDRDWAALRATIPADRRDIPPPQPALPQRVRIAPHAPGLPSARPDLSPVGHFKRYLHPAG